MRGSEELPDAGGGCGGDESSAEPRWRPNGDTNAGGGDPFVGKSGAPDADADSDVDAAETDDVEGGIGSDPLDEASDERVDECRGAFFWCMMGDV